MEELLIQAAIDASLSSISSSSSLVSRPEGNIKFTHYNAQIGKVLVRRNSLSDSESKSSKIIPHSGQIVAKTNGSSIFWG